MSQTRSPKGIMRTNLTIGWKFSSIFQFTKVFVWNLFKYIRHNFIKYVKFKLIPERHKWQNPRLESVKVHYMDSASVWFSYGLHDGFKAAILSFVSLGIQTSQLSAIHFKFQWNDFHPIVIFLSLFSCLFLIIYLESLFSSTLHSISDSKNKFPCPFVYIHLRWLSFKIWLLFIFKFIIQWKIIIITN